MKATFPWPPRDLSPNARVHWARLAKVKAAFKQECFVIARQAMRKIPADARPTVSFTFYKPSRRRGDADNMLASCKCMVDAIALVIGCDDSRWRWQIEVAEQIGGMVVVEVTP